MQSDPSAEPPVSHPRVRSLPTIAGVNAQRQIVLVGFLQAQNCTTTSPNPVAITLYGKPGAVHRGGSRRLC